jgi:hypothetical protein
MARSEAEKRQAVTKLKAAKTNLKQQAEQCASLQEEVMAATQLEAGRVLAHIEEERALSLSQATTADESQAQALQAEARHQAEVGKLQESLIAQVARHSAEAGKLEEERQALTKQIAAAAAEHSAAVDKLEESLTAAVGKLEEKRQDLMAQVAQHSAEVGKLEEERQDLTEQVAQLKEQHASEVARLLEERQASERAQELADEAKCAAERTKWERQQQEQQQQQQQETAEHADIVAKLKRQQADEVGQFKEELQQTLGLLLLHEQQVADLTEELVASKADLMADLAASKAELVAELEASRVELAASKAELAAIKESQEADPVGMTGCTTVSAAAEFTTLLNSETTVSLGGGEATASAAAPSQPSACSTPISSTAKPRATPRRSASAKASTPEVCTTPLCGAAAARGAQLQPTPVQDADTPFTAQVVALTERHIMRAAKLTEAENADEEEKEEVVEEGEEVVRGEGGLQAAEEDGEGKGGRRRTALVRPRKPAERAEGSRYDIQIGF